MNERVLIVGTGRLGSALAQALRRAGVHVSVWRGRGPWPSRRTRIDVALLAVADPFIEGVAAKLAPRLDAHCVVLHASGARSIEALHPLAPRSRGVMHPLVSFASRRAPSLASCTVVIAGDPGAVRAARSLARVLRLSVIAQSIHGPRYHAAAALVANGAAALASSAVGSLEAQGVPRRAAERAIAGLLRSVADNVAALGLPAALTGPIVRGDAATVAAHREAVDARTLRAYDALAPLILDVARAAGLSPTAARRIRAVLTRDRGRPRSRST